LLTGVIVDHHCLFVCFVDIGVIVDHHCLFVCFVDIGVIVDLVNNHTNINKTNK
jgi:hypothetical protein